MREQNTTSVVKGVGMNPVVALARYTLKGTEPPEIIDGLGVSLALGEYEGEYVLTLDPVARTRMCVCFPMIEGEEAPAPVWVARQDTAAGTITLKVVGDPIDVVLTAIIYGVSQ